jgi:two-component system, chemotaxis family, chemotaxis protein CheY
VSVKRVLSVGQCFADHSSLLRTFRTHFGAEVVAADSASEALALLEREAFDLVLVNRIFDADGGPGLDLIRQLMQEPLRGRVPVMLVSNYQWAQEEAVQAGARPGFGKSSLGQSQMLERVRAVLGEGGEAGG